MTHNVVSGFATFGPLIGDTTASYALIMAGQRAIGDLYPHVVIEETHRDELMITQHPVEFGTPVTDHAFMQPYTVEIRCGWSNSTAQTSGYVQAVYQEFLGLQVSRVPFTISTGKRQYKSMLLRSLMVKTDPDSEFVLMCVATAQQIVITNTQVSAGSSPNSNGASSFKELGGTPLGMPSANGGATSFGGLGGTWPSDVSHAGTQPLAANPNAIPQFPGQP